MNKELIENPEIEIPETIGVDDWVEKGRNITVTARVIAAHFKKWKDVGCKKWKRSFVREKIEQFQLELGDPVKERKSNINADSNSGFLNIHGIAGGFNMWHRRMKDNIESMDVDSLRKIRELLTPIVKFCQGIDKVIENK